MRWLFCLIGWFKPINLIAWKIWGEKCWNHSTFCCDVFQWLIWLVQVIQYQKKLPRKTSSWLLLPSGEMPLMMNTNSKILPTQDSNLSCYSPATLTFSAPAFYLSSFMILVGGKFPFPKNRHFLCDGGQRCDMRIPPGKLPSTNCSWKIAPIEIAPGGWVRLGVRQFIRGNFPRSNSPSSIQREAEFQG